VHYWPGKEDFTHLSVKACESCGSQDTTTVIDEDSPVRQQLEEIFQWLGNGIETDDP
jgi:hypothetical protein